MAANLEDQLIDKVRALPPDKQQEATTAGQSGHGRYARARRQRHIDA